jgi:cobyrinic acid a,c-diamide synthase
MKYPRLTLGATHSGTGKTTLTMALILAVRRRGLTVQSYKVGPDYIDPGFHTLAAERPCRNLDTRMLGPDAVLELFQRSAEKADIALIEGVMGLYDGAGALDERGSTAHLAKTLQSPVILCIDASAMARSAAAVALGFTRFDPATPVGGFLFNNVGSRRHYETVKAAVEDATGIPVYGYVRRTPEALLPERHLGLVPAWENGSLPQSIVDLSEAVEETVEVDSLIEAARAAPPLPGPGRSILPPRSKRPSKPVRIAVAYDSAFHFYYRDNLDILEMLGAELVNFSPLADDRLPDYIAGVYLGGGYPELHAAVLESNTSMRRCLREACEDGLPVYAECGGLMYLMDGLITFEGKRCEMAGVFPGTVKMEKKLHALGYYSATALKDSVAAKKGWKIPGHVFHWSSLIDIDPETEYAFRLNAPGKEAVFDGFARANTLASYFHIHFASDVRWASRFVDMCRSGRGKPNR